MAAGDTVKLEMYAYWAPEDLLQHDFSIVVWAEKSPVTMTATHDHPSVGFPNYKLSENVIIYDLHGNAIVEEADPSGGGDEGGLKLPYIY